MSPAADLPRLHGIMFQLKDKGFFHTKKHSGRIAQAKRAVGGPVGAGEPSGQGA